MGAKGDLPCTRREKGYLIVPPLLLARPGSEDRFAWSDVKKTGREQERIHTRERTRGMSQKGSWGEKTHRGKRDIMRGKRRHDEREKERHDEREKERHYENDDDRRACVPFISP